MYYKINNPKLNDYGKGGEKVTIPRKVVQKVLSSEEYLGIEVSCKGHVYQYSKETLRVADIPGNRMFELKYGEFEGQDDYLDNYLISRSNFPNLTPENSPIIGDFKENTSTELLNKILEQNNYIIQKLDRIYV